MTSRTVHVVHPITYLDHTGPNYDARSYCNMARRAGTLLSRALTSENTSVINHELMGGGMFSAIFAEVILGSASSLKALKDERVKLMITGKRGMPVTRAAEKPNDRVLGDSWERLGTYSSNPERIRELTDGSKTTLFLGGYLDVCLGNFVAYYAGEFRRTDEGIYVVEDLCTTHGSPEEVGKAKEKLLGIDGLKFVNSRQARRLLL